MERATGFSGRRRQSQRNRDQSLTKSKGNMPSGGYPISYSSGTFNSSGTNKVVNSGTSPAAGIPTNSGLLITWYGISSTNQIGGPPIPVGTPVYEQFGTNPPVPINQTIGPSNTYIDPTGVTSTQGKIVPVPSPSATSWPTGTLLPMLPSSGTSPVSVYAPSNTFRGTITRTITATPSHSGATNGTINIK
jgi:hypothetical protein